MFGSRNKLAPPKPDAVDLKQQVAIWAERLPPAWSLKLRTGVVVAAMLVGGTLVVCVTPFLVVAALYLVMTVFAHAH